MQKNIAEVYAWIYFGIILFLMFVFSPVSAFAAALSFSPSSGTFEVGSRVSIKVMATSNVPFNAVSGVISIPTSIFTVESVSKSGSILNFWVTEPAKIGKTVKFEGVALGGFLGSSGSVVNINLRAIAEGTGSLSFQSGQILANDGEGTDITGNMIGATFSVKEATTKQSEPKPKSTPVETIEEEEPQPVPSLHAPEIMLGEKYGGRAILGTSEYPKSQALITFISESGVKVFILGSAEADGSFNILVPNSLKKGAYKVNAIMVKEDKTNSETSNVIKIDIGNVFSDTSQEIWIFILLLILAIIYLILRVNHHLVKGGYMADRTKNELRKTETLVHKSFDLLREDVADYDKGKLSVAEHKAISGIKKDINEAEKVINKKINDIESE